jgi:hypoxanthine phosphoribosyltransferase
LLNKQERRVKPVPIAYKGFDIPNAFVVGYGLDFNELYRNLTAVHVLEHD